MVSAGDGPLKLCEGISRREWLRAGGLGFGGLVLPELLSGRASAAAEAAGGLRRPRSFGRAKSCIVAFLFGAPGHQDLWDMKPEGSAEVRGEFRPIPTSVPGIDVCEHLPLLARQAEHLALVRSVTHPDNTHTVAMHYMLTGHRHAQPNTNPQNQATDFPTFGSVVRKLRPGAGPIPSGVSLNAPANQVSANNHIFPGFFAGFLGAEHDPLFLGQDPSRPDFRPFQPEIALSDGRLSRRRSLLEEIDRQWRVLEPVAATHRFDEHRRRALELTLSAAAREAWNLRAEPPTLREKYGSHPFGQGLLLARRLVEAGVGLVTVNWMRDDAFWDTHADNFKQLKGSLLPPFDRAFSALIADLHERGLLDETLVICLGEFGRTPTINKNAGRDHWAACNTVVFAGGGIRGGQVYGSSDRDAAYPRTDPVTPEDLAATLYHALGINPATELIDPLGRPIPLSTGSPLVQLFS